MYSRATLSHLFAAVDAPTVQVLATNAVGNEAFEPPNFSGIYMIRCKSTGKVYVGSAVWIAKRWRGHREGLRKGRHHNKHLQSAWNKYGENAFEFCVLSSAQKDLLITEEQRFIDMFRACDPSFGFNANPVAGSNLGRKYSTEVRARMSLAKRGSVVTQDAREKIRIAMMGNKHLLGHKHSEETRAKLSKPRIGKRSEPRGPLSPEHKAKISEFNRGKILNEQHRAKISASHIGKKQSAEHRAKLARSQCKLSSDRLMIVKEMLALGHPYKQIACAVGCSAQTICNIKNGRVEVYKCL